MRWAHTLADRSCKPPGCAGDVIHPIHLGCVICAIVLADGIKFGDYIVPVYCTNIWIRNRKKPGNISIDLVNTAGGRALGNRQSLEMGLKRV